MYVDITVEPGKFVDETGVYVRCEEYLPYTSAYVGAHTYIWNMHIDNGIEFEVGNGTLFHNIQIGNFNSIGHNLSIHLGRNHNIKRIETGALDLFYQRKNIVQRKGISSFNQKGSVVLQNDIWVGEKVTIVPNVIVRNGAVIARNSHVVSDVPPYAIVGGNPAKIIGYRYPKEIIKKLQLIQWWYWDEDKLIENADYFNEDVEGFCNHFYKEAKEAFDLEVEQRAVKNDTYFAFVDWYEPYSSYPYIFKQFLETYANKNDKRLILFALQDKKTGSMDDALCNNLNELFSKSNNSKDVKCKIELMTGTIDDAKKTFLSCSHYIIARTYYAVMFSCLADKYNMDIISGVDSKIQFEKQRNMYKLDE